MWRAIVLAAGVLAASTSFVDAQSGNEVARGRAYAVRVCAECHAIDRSRPSPNLKATPFGTVADTPGMTATALAVWLRTPHPTMPNLIVADGDLGDIIAYVLSLRTPR